MSDRASTKNAVVLGETEQQEQSGSVDWIATELLRETKQENCRKDNIIKILIKTIVGIVIGAIISLVATNLAWIWYINHYDFSSTQAYYTEQTAEGVYAIVDSDGNIISSDLSYDEAQKLLEVLVDGGSSSENSQQSNQETD